MVMMKAASRLTVVRKIDRLDALKLRFSLDGRFLESRMYHDVEIAEARC